jgi:asparagine synthase (glutamine-hydrolysing)
LKIFNNESNVRKEAYFDKMTHFDFKCLLPALLQVEDRMSMAHGIESRVPLLDHKLIEFAASIPADIKFKNGTLKNLLKSTYSKVLPNQIINRRDKMGFPVPLKEWFSSDLKQFITEIFAETEKSNRPFINTGKVVNNFGNEGQFSRKTWGLLSLELWHQLFHDREEYYKSLIK